MLTTYDGIFKEMFHLHKCSYSSGNCIKHFSTTGHIRSSQRLGGPQLKKKRSIPHFWNVMLSDYLACEKTRNLGPLELLQFPFGFRHYNLDHFPTKIYKLIHIFFCLTQTTRGPD